MEKYPDAIRITRWPPTLPHGGFGGGRRETDLSRHRARRLSYFHCYPIPEMNRQLTGGRGSRAFLFALREPLMNSPDIRNAPVINGKGESVSLID